MGIIPPTQPKLNKKLPGTQRQRRYAKKVLFCKSIENGAWEVWGGRDKHIVTKNFECDCWAYKNNNQICSHIIKIGMELAQAGTDAK